MTVRRILFPAVVVRPPVSPGRCVLAKRSAGDGFERSGDQALRRRVERIVIEQVEQLGYRAQALLAGEQA